MSGPPLVFVALARIIVGIYSSVVSGLTNAAVFTWDFGLALFNLIAPNRPSQRVVPDGFAGAGGIWPQYVSPGDGDSRCSCPALNAMANHGILPHSGRGISFRELNAKIRSTYNFAPSFCFFVPNFAADMMCRNYWTDTFDLKDIDIPNGIEHDASLCREDRFFVPDQGKPAVKLVNELLASGTGPNGDLTAADLARLTGKRRIESKRNNPQFHLSTFHKVFGSSNSATLLTIMGGRVNDLRTFLLEERIPDGWQPRIRHPMGLTIAEFNKTALAIELGVVEELPEALGGASNAKKTA